MKTKLKNILLYTIFFSLLGLVITSEKISDDLKKDRKRAEPIVLDARIVKSIDFGLHNTMADLSWLSAIQYMGGTDSDTYEKMDDFLNLAISLDPKFPDPYAYGILILPTIGEPQKAVEIGLKGIKDARPDWRIPYYLATTYHMEMKDKANAAKYFDIAANTPGAPAVIQKAAASYGSYANDRDRTKNIWQGIYENAENEAVKKRAENYMFHFEIMDFLEKSAKDYYEIFKKYPGDPDELVQAKILKATPVDPFGFTFKFDQSGHVVVQ